MKITKQFLLGCLALLSSFATLADVINIKSDAPSKYVVQKGDTLWDISKMFLDEAWLWPELWRNNTQIENPHLIYPGDTLSLRYIDGVPTIVVERGDKGSLVLSPEQKVVLKARAIDVLPWDTLAPYVANHLIMDTSQYDALPHLLGDPRGTPMFETNDYVLSHRLVHGATLSDVVRKQGLIKDSSGKILGLQVNHIASSRALASDNEQHHFIRLSDSKQEARQGDKVIPRDVSWKQNIELKAASNQRGELVASVNGRRLVGKQDLVIINLGKDLVQPGTVMGVYARGPSIVDGGVPTYKRQSSTSFNVFADNTIQQPALKVGELIVFKSFEHASYAWVTQANTYLKGGEIVAKP